MGYRVIETKIRIYTAKKEATKKRRHSNFVESELLIICILKTAAYSTPD